ncbi:MAG: L,D-transpeptidase [Chthoniobacteraceae bacterium]
MKNSFLAASVLSALVTFPLPSQAETTIVVSVRDQELAIVRDGTTVAKFPISTSKFGVGDRPRSYGTPLGTLKIAAKIGQDAPVGAVFKGRRMTGEIIRVNSPGRDPIVTRILQLRGCERSNANALSRGIYIHGTPQERRIGRPASYGCIRMRSRDVVKLFRTVPVGARVEIVPNTLRDGIRVVATPAPKATLASR